MSIFRKKKTLFATNSLAILFDEYFGNVCQTKKETATAIFHAAEQIYPDPDSRDDGVIKRIRKRFLEEFNEALYQEVRDRLEKY